jgi:hypothetical protein
MARHPDTVYRRYPDIPGEYFRCGRLSAEFSVDSCGKRWKACQGKEHLGMACYRCPIGAAHADASVTHAQYQKPECVRCHQLAGKLVRGLLCVSCYNRQQEVLKGQDRRGRVPNAYERAGQLAPQNKKLVRIHLFEVRYVPPGGREVATLRYLGADRQEAMLAVLRQHPQPPVIVACAPVSSGEDLFGGYHRFTR